MVDFNNVVLVYIVIGLVMVFGGALTIQEAGAVTYFIQEDDNGRIQPSDDAINNVGNKTDVSQTVVNLAVGGIVLVVGLAKALLAFMNWPILVLTQNNAPPAAVGILGVPMTSAFYLSVIGLFWRST